MARPHLARRGRALGPGAWTYSLSFPTPATWDKQDTALLIFDSINMAADISLNGQAIGAATSQHLRYVFQVDTVLALPGDVNTLTVAFPPTVEDTRNDAGRFQGCSGGWDWAP